MERHAASTLSGAESLSPTSLAVMQSFDRRGSLSALAAARSTAPTCAVNFAQLTTGIISLFAISFATTICPHHISMSKRQTSARAFPESVKSKYLQPAARASRVISPEVVLKATLCRRVPEFMVQWIKMARV
jgi:hypothetical protein